MHHGNSRKPPSPSRPLSVWMVRIAHLLWRPVSTLTVSLLWGWPAAAALSLTISLLWTLRAHCAGGGEPGPSTWWKGREGGEETAFREGVGPSGESGAALSVDPFDKGKEPALTPGRAEAFLSAGGAAQSPLRGAGPDPGEMDGVAAFIAELWREAMVSGDFERFRQAHTAVMGPAHPIGAALAGSGTDWERAIAARQAEGPQPVEGVGLRVFPSPTLQNDVVVLSTGREDGAGPLVIDTTHLEPEAVKKVYSEVARVEPLGPYISKVFLQNLGVRLGTLPLQDYIRSQRMLQYMGGGVLQPYAPPGRVPAYGDESTPFYTPLDGTPAGSGAETPLPSSGSGADSSRPSSGGGTRAGGEGEPEGSGPGGGPEGGHPDGGDSSPWWIPEEEPGVGEDLSTAASAGAGWGNLLVMGGFLLWKIGAKTLVIAAMGGSMAAAAQLAVVGTVLGVALHKTIRLEALRRAQANAREAARVEGEEAQRVAEASERLARERAEELFEEARASDGAWGGWGEWPF